MPKNKTCQFKSTIYKEYICPKTALEGSDYCIFHKPAKIEEETKLFQEKIEKKLLSKDYDFRGFSFPEEIDFDNRLFDKTAEFSESIFEQSARFIGSIFNEEAHFRETVFKGVTDFEGSTFKKTVDFVRSTFKKDIHFEESIFKGKTFFGQSTFLEHAGFRGSVFEESADFWGSTFEESANFSRSLFKGPAYFEGSTFKGEANFWGSTFEKEFDFNGVTFEKVTYLDHVKFKILTDTDLPFRKAKIAWHREGNYVEEGKYHYQEMDYIRKQKKWYVRYLWANIFHRCLHGYGEKPHRVILWAVAIIVACALLFMSFGIGETHLFGPKPLPTYNILRILPKLYTLSRTDLANIGRYFYFSVVTFTTLGYGDLHPTHPISHLISSIEAFTGMFMMALFVLTFGRKWRR